MELALHLEITSVLKNESLVAKACSDLDKAVNQVKATEGLLAFFQRQVLYYKGLEEQITDETVNDGSVQQRTSSLAEMEKCVAFKVKSLSAARERVDNLRFLIETISTMTQNNNAEELEKLGISL